ncbi:MAG: hypothetical protein NT031_13010, partial [Planctomycetota bacterium]|nr:hypothetical protein [Planctomycetota bacterium]
RGWPIPPRPKLRESWSKSATFFIRPPSATVLLRRLQSKTYVEGPVDYTNLRTEFIGLIYEGLLDYRVKRTDQEIGPQVFLDIGRQPVLPLARLEQMLADDPKALKDLLTTLKKEKVTASVAEEAQEETAEEEEAEPVAEEEGAAEVQVEAEPQTASVAARNAPDFLDADARAKRWARDAVVLVGLASKKRKGESESEFQARTDQEASKLIKKVVATGEFYLVRAGNTRKGTGTFYTRPQLAVPTVHRTLQPLCFDTDKDGILTPKTPETILNLKVCDTACGSASFLVAALHYLTDALYESLRRHCDLDDPGQSTRLTLPLGRPRSGKGEEELVPFPPNDPQRGELFTDSVKAILRRHVVERCIYGVDINPLAVEFARVSLWIETMDKGLPFSFLDHKIKVGNSLVGCWLRNVLDYPITAWQREGGDGKDGPRTALIETFLKGQKVGNRRTGDGKIKLEMGEVIAERFSKMPPLFPGQTTSADAVVAAARDVYEKLHRIPAHKVSDLEAAYRELEKDRSLDLLKRAMDEWCAVWFWPMDANSARCVPTPRTFHAQVPERDEIIHALNEHAGLRFFHWELEFPDVFTRLRCGLGQPTVGGDEAQLARVLQRI